MPTWELRTGDCGEEVDCVLVCYARLSVRICVSGLVVTVTLYDVRPQGENYSVRAERVSAEIKSRRTRGQ